MPCRKQFWVDPYQTILETRVAGVVGSEITVEETIFYAFSGGQESDSGVFDDRPVRQARKDDLEIFYALDPDHGYQIGDPLIMEIDWARRYKLMRLHYAAEIVLELCYRRLKGVEKTGAHIAEDKARLDFVWPRNISEYFEEFTSEIDRLVAADSEIISAFEDEAAERRYWEIDGFARVPCGGTHLKRTGEIGGLILKRKNPGKGKERVDIFLAE